MSVVAGYEGLTETQQAEFDRLMTIPGNQWPESLKYFFTAKRPHCGDEIADVVGQWVKHAFPAKESTS